MDSPYTIGLLGYGRIGGALHDYIRTDPDFELDYAFVRSRKAELPADKQLTDPDTLATRNVDLVIEAATHEVLADLGESVLEASDLMVLSGSAFVDDAVQQRIESAATHHDHSVYVPHAALLGIDGLVDAGDTLSEVSITATKAPSHLDFAYTDAYDPDTITDREVLYEGSVRGLCQRFPRNFNSHAGVALASLGLDETKATLIADPSVDTADHVITASGEGYELEIVRESTIEGVTGDYTLVSIWGSIRRALNADPGLQFI